MPVSMSTPARSNPPPKAAILHFGDGEFAVLSPGDYVSCATSGAQISLLALRYWSVERQQAYDGPLEYMAAEKGS